MRISDWSSDVCSSDLARGVSCNLLSKPMRITSKRSLRPRSALPQLKFFVKLPGCHSSNGVTSMRELCAPQHCCEHRFSNQSRKPLPGYPTNPTRDDSREQTGRASRRERVCQYV